MTLLTAAFCVLLAPAPDYYVYVTAESADEVYLVKFDGREATIVRKIEVGYQPTEIEGPHGLTMSPDGRHWYLSMAHGKPNGILYKYATGSDKLVAQVELGYFPATMQISKETGLLYCVNFDLHGDMKPSSVSIVDPEKMVEVGRTKTGPMPHGSRISPDGKRHYSCAMMTGQLFEIDTFSFKILRTLNMDGDPKHHKHHDPKAKKSKPTWVHPHPKLPRVYLALNGADEIVEVDLKKWEIVRRFKTDKGPYNVEVTPDGRKLVASYKTAGAVGIWDLKTGKELAKIPSSRSVTHGVVLAPDGKYAFVSSEGKGSEKGTLDVFDLTTDKKVATVELGLQAGGITFWKIDK